MRYADPGSLPAPINRSTSGQARDENIAAHLRQGGLGMREPDGQGAEGAQDLAGNDQ